MLFDHRTYICRPGTLVAQLKLYEEKGFAAQKRHLGEPVFYGVVETGEINSYVHIWAYEDAADRERRRADMEADPEWQAFKAASAAAGNLTRQENKLMNSAPFFTLKR